MEEGVSITSVTSRHLVVLFVSLFVFGGVLGFVLFCFAFIGSLTNLPKTSVVLLLTEI